MDADHHHHEQPKSLKDLLFGLVIQSMISFRMPFTTSAILPSWT